MTQNHSRTRWLLTAGCFLSFFVFGFVDNLKGPTLPALLRELNFSYGQGGSILLGGYWGFLIATLLTGPLADRAGKKVVMLIAGACLCVGLALYSAGNSFWMLTAAMVIIGLGTGSIEVGGNALIVDLHSARRGLFLNLLGVAHGVGAMIVPIMAGLLLSDGVSWRGIHQLTLILTGLFFLYFLLTRFPVRSTPTGSGLTLQSLRQSGFNRDMVQFYGMIACYVAAEIGTAAWIVEFLQQVRGMSVERSTLYLSLFFGFVMAGRVIGGLLAERIGYLRIMLFFASAATCCIAIGIFGPPGLAFFLPLTGLFFSIIFPTTTAAVSARHTENLGAIMGILFAFGGIGGMIGPWLIGVGSDWLGIQFGFGIVIGYCVIVVGMLAVLLLQGSPTQENTKTTYRIT